MYPYVGYSTTTDTKINKNDDLIPINKVTVPVKKVDKFVIKELPDFIKNKTLTFVPQLSSFLFNSLPKDIVNKLEKFQDFSNYLKGLGFYREQDYVRLSIKDFYLNQVYPVPKGLFVVKDGDGDLRVKLTKFDDNDLIAQKVDVNSSSTVSVYLPKNINTKYTINGQVYDFIPDGDFMKTVLEITSENKVLYTESSPTPLVLQVKLESNTFDTVDNPIKSQDINIINKLLKWFGY
jgi:hypothetical protein